jgi:MarR family transcriptional regulator, temperature-dependent positive regulator of motility
MSVLRAVLQRNKIAYLYRVGYLFNQGMGPVYKYTEREMDIARPQFASLFCIAQLGESTASHIVELTGIPKNSVSRAVQRLLSDGLIESHNDEADGRRAILTITKAGRKVHDEVLALLVERQKQMLAPLDANERKELDRLLSKIVDRDDGWAQST